MSIMMMMISSFTGHERLMDIYEMAVREKYSFGPYGDAMLVL
jgi:S-adenosylmethionine:tRNA ribosyltransferase-isomerase